MPSFRTSIFTLVLAYSRACRLSFRETCDLFVNFASVPSRGGLPREQIFLKSPLPAAITHICPNSLFLPGVGQNIASAASPADRRSALLVSTFPVHSASFPPNLPGKWSGVAAGEACKATCLT